MEKASIRQLSFGGVKLRNASSQRLAELSKNQETPPPKECPYSKVLHRSQGTVFEPVVRMLGSLKRKKELSPQEQFEKATESKKKLHAQFIGLLESQNFKFHRKVAQLRHQLSTSDKDPLELERSTFQRMLDEGKSLDALIDYVGEIVTLDFKRSTEPLLEGFKRKDAGMSKGQAKDFVHKVNYAATLDFSFQLAFIKEGLKKLSAASDNLGADFLKLLENNNRVIQAVSLNSGGAMKRFMNFMGIKHFSTSNFNRQVFKCLGFDLAGITELKSMSDEEESPVLVPTEEFLDKLEADAQSHDLNTSYLDKETDPELLRFGVFKDKEVNIMDGEVMGCPANKLKFPAEIKEEFSASGEEYKLEATILREFAQYINEVVKELFLPNLDKIASLAKAAGQ